MPTDNDWLTRPRTLALVAATAIAVYRCYRLAFPFIPAITWAVGLAVLTSPLKDRLAQRIKSPALAAAATVALVAVVIVTPGFFLGQRFATEAGHGIEAAKIQTQSGQWKATVESSPALTRALRWIGPNVDVRGVAEQAANAIASFLYSFIGGSVWVLAQLLITFFTLFYLLRDRRTILKKAKSLVPLPEADVEKVFTRVRDTIYGTFYGSFTVAVVQGTLGGLIFWLLDLPAPLFWGMVMTLLALVPVLGAPVVWIPAAIYLALTGHLTQALILTAWGMTAIGLIDNLLYPVLVGDKMHLHTLVVFFAVVGGVMLFGASGLILGPVAVVVAETLIEVWQQRNSAMDAGNSD